MAQTTDKPKLTAVERRILAAAAAGDVAVFDRDDDPDDPADLEDWSGREVAASFMRKLAKGKKKWPVAAEGVRVSGVRVVGRLDLSGTTLSHPLGFQRAMIEEPVSLEGASTRSLAFVRSRVGPIAASGLHCDGSLELSQSALGAVDLTDATITGDLSTESALLSGGLDTGGATISGDCHPPEIRSGAGPAWFRPASANADTSSEAANDADDEPVVETIPDPPPPPPATNGTTSAPLSERIGSTPPPIPNAAPAIDPPVVEQSASSDEPTLPELPRTGELPPAAVNVPGAAGPRLSPWRVLGLWLLAAAVAAVLVSLAPDDVFRSDVTGQDTAAACGEEVECFNSIAYGLDVVAPVIDLDQYDSWHPDGAASWGDWYRYGRWIAVIVGWAFTVGFVLAATRRLLHQRRA